MSGRQSPVDFARKCIQAARAGLLQIVNDCDIAARQTPERAKECAYIADAARDAAHLLDQRAVRADLHLPKE